MSLASEDKHLTVPAARLALAAPREWATFLAAFKEYSDAKRDLLVRATLEEIQRSQGRAQQCSALLETMTNAVVDSNKANSR